MHANDSVKILAQKYKVTQSTIKNIIKGKTWKHVIIETSKVETKPKTKRAPSKKSIPNTHVKNKPEIVQNIRI